MLIKLFEAIVPIASMGAMCLAGAWGLIAPVEPAANTGESDPAAIIQDQQPKQSYLGSDSCFTCHRDQGGSWTDTAHAKAFEVLPEKYRNDSSCLKCHVTAFGEPGGYAPGMTADAAKPLLSVGCESCHGPGAVHAAAVQTWMMAEPADEERLLKEMKAAIRKGAPDDVCAKCHTAQGHQQHPPYDGQPSSTVAKNLPMGNGLDVRMASSAITAPPSPHSYNVKTCGSCHYEQYNTWRTGHHVGLSTKIPATYANDQSCLECHRESQDSAQWYTASTDSTDSDSKDKQSGIGCESCHGSGYKHVMFNKQYIHAPPLTGELEQAARQSISKEKPATACSSCHIQMAHKAHPKYETPEKKDAAESK